MTLWKQNIKSESTTLQRGELTLFPKEPFMFAPDLHTIPNGSN